MKYVTLQRTAMIGGLPKGPNDGQQLVTNAQAKHLVDNGDVDPDNVDDAEDHPSETPEPDFAQGDEKRIEAEVAKRLKAARKDDAKQLADALAKQQAEGDEALKAEIERIRKEGEDALAAAIAEATGGGK